MNGIIKTGATLLTAAGVAVGAAETITNVVEQINYENVHEINITEVYKVNGESVTYDYWIETKTNLETEEESVNVDSELAKLITGDELENVSIDNISLFIVGKNESFYGYLANYSGEEIYFETTEKIEETELTATKLVFVEHLLNKDVNRYIFEIIF